MKKKEDIRVFKRLAKIAKPYWLLLVCIFVIDLLSTPLALLTPIPLKIVVDSVLGSEPMPWFLNWFPAEHFSSTNQAMLIFAVLLQILLALLSQLQSSSSYVLKTYCGGKLTYNLREKLFKHVQNLSFKFHDTRGTADSIYRIQYDATAIENITIHGVFSISTSIINLFTFAYVIALINFKLTLVALCVAPFLILYTGSYKKRMLGKYHEKHNLTSGVLKIVQESLNALRVIKAFGTEGRERKRFEEGSESMLYKNLQLASAESLFGLLVNMTTAIGTGIVIYIGVNSVLREVMTLGELLMVISYLAILYGPLQSISKQIASLQGKVASAQRVFELLDETPDVVDKPNAISIDQIKGEVRYNNVSFSYDGQTNVLNEINLNIPAGAKVGIAGKTGAGKTTLVSLLPRFYDTSVGSISIDGIDIRDYKLRDLRDQFSIVLQDPLLFSTTMKENIAYPKPDATEEEIIEAAKAANAHDFIMKLPDQYDTLVGERGMSLSGGERQRISLARAFIKSAPIIILDEPTSSVDTKTETLIIQAMERLMKNHTTFMIAHRLSTLEMCNIILNVENGEVTATYKHELVNS